MVIIGLPPVKGFGLLTGNCCLIRSLGCLSVRFRLVALSR